jgi:hypothetical protein
MTTVVLLHKFWDEKRHGVGVTPAVEMEEVLVGLHILKQLEPKYASLVPNCDFTNMHLGGLLPAAYGRL